jgi:hypothetical protein
MPVIGQLKRVINLYEFIEEIVLMKIEATPNDNEVQTTAR